MSEEVVAVTPKGAYLFESLRDALEHPIVSLADPIFSQSGPIDKTLIRGPGLENFSSYDGDPWTFLVKNVLPTPPAADKAKRRRGVSCGQ